MLELVGVTSELHKHHNRIIEKQSRINKQTPNKQDLPFEPFKSNIIVKLDIKTPKLEATITEFRNYRFAPWVGCKHR